MRGGGRGWSGAAAASLMTTAIFLRGRLDFGAPRHFNETLASIHTAASAGGGRRYRCPALHVGSDQKIVGRSTNRAQPSH